MRVLNSIEIETVSGGELDDDFELMGDSDTPWGSVHEGHYAEATGQCYPTSTPGVTCQLETVTITAKQIPNTKIITTLPSFSINLGFVTANTGTITKEVPLYRETATYSVPK
ncbi:MAG: hypothetical protein ABL903_17495 [Methylococcales bacterium]